MKLSLPLGKFKPEHHRQLFGLKSTNWDYISITVDEQGHKNESCFTENNFYLYERLEDYPLIDLTVEEAAALAAAFNLTGSMYESLLHAVGDKLKHA